MQIPTVGQAEKALAVGGIVLVLLGIAWTAITPSDKKRENPEKTELSEEFIEEDLEEGIIEFANAPLTESGVEFVTSTVTRAQAAKKLDVAGLIEFMNNTPLDVGVVEFVTGSAEDNDDVATVEFVNEPVVSYEHMRAAGNNTNLLTSEDILAHKFRASGETPIMGASGVSIGQMVHYYNDRARYPEFYKDTDAPTIEIFCQIYIDECLAEGVRYDVAFCQCMKETGFLRYGGSVSREQFNFAGMGASGGGVKGITYGSVRQGIRAHVQHLKAFASTDDMVNPPVDSRWSKVKRGSAVYVEYLGIGENPNHTGWATASRYGYSLMNDYVNVLSRY